MDITLFVLLAVALLVVFYGIAIYNRLVSLKHNVSQAWANIDVLLKQRHDELPKLVATCKEHMQYESDTLEKIVQARNLAYDARQSGDLTKLGASENAMRAGLGQLFAVSERYPELTADGSFQQLRQRITGLEDGIADRREYYNASVNAYNIGIERFPDVLIAKRFGYSPRQLLEFDATELTDHDISELFKQ